MNILQNITVVAERKGVTLTEIERACEFSKSSMRKWSENIPSIEKIIRVADYLETSLDFIIYGEEKRASLTENEQQLLNNYRKCDVIDRARIEERALSLSERSESVKSKKSVKLPHRNRIRLYDSSVSAGTGLYIDYASYESVETDDDVQSGDFAVRVSGDSMTPRFCDGDIVLVESAPRVEIGEIGIFIVDSQAYIKQLGKDCLISLNDKYPPIKISKNDNAYCQGRVIKVLDIRKGV